MTSRDPLTPVLSVVVCGAGPATAIGTLVKLACERGWIVQVIATPAALDFFDPAAIEAQTGSPVRSQYRKPGEPRPGRPGPARSRSATAGQSGLAQKNRRTASRITTRWPPTGASARRHWYALCTRAEDRPRAGNRRSTRSPSSPEATRRPQDEPVPYTPQAATRRKGQLPSRNTGQLQIQFSADVDKWENRVRGSGGERNGQRRD